MATTRADGNSSYVPQETSSSFLRSLHQELVGEVGAEIKLTMQVAVMTAAGLSRAETVRRLESSELEVKMAMLRLQRISEGWT
jgi:hypothetical protein